MGRFFRTARAEYLQGTQYELPVDLMLKVIQNDNSLRSAVEQQATKTEYELLNSPHLAFDKERLKAIQQGYSSQIEELSQSVYNDVNIMKSARPKMQALNRRLMEDKLNGELGAITNRYNAISKFQEENKDVKDKDPATYNLALSYELNKLQQATLKDPKATFSSYKILATPDFRKSVTDEIAKLKASKQTIPDGKGYLMKVSQLSPDRIIALAVSNILSRPEYKEYAKQQTMYGVSGFMNPDGTAINPFTLISPDGTAVTQEQLSKMSDADRMKLRRSVNPNWRFSNEISQIAQAFAYQEQDMSSDGTWVAKMKEAGANARHSQSLALAREKFAWQKQKDMADLELKMNGGNGSSSSGGSGNFSDAYTGVKPANRYGSSLDGYQTNLDFSSDLADIKSGNSAVLQRLQGAQGNILKIKALQGIKIGDIDASRLASNLINKGVDLRNLENEKNRTAIIEQLKASAKDGRVKVYNHKEKRVIDVSVNDRDGLITAAKYAAEAIQTHSKSTINDLYTKYNQTTNMSTGFGLDPAMSSRILNEAFHNPQRVKVKDTVTGRYLSPDEMKLMLNNKSNIRMYSHPSANSNYGGVVVMDYLDKGAVGTKAGRYVIEGANYDDVTNYLPQSVLIRELAQNKEEAMYNTDLAKLYYAVNNSGRNVMSQYDLKRVSPAIAKLVDKIHFDNEGNMNLRMKNGTTQSVPTGGNAVETLYKVEQYLLSLH